MGETPPAAAMVAVLLPGRAAVGESCSRKGCERITAAVSTGPSGAKYTFFACPASMTAPAGASCTSPVAAPEALAGAALPVSPLPEYSWCVWLCRWWPWRRGWAVAPVAGCLVHCAACEALSSLLDSPDDCCAAAATRPGGGGGGITAVGTGSCEGCKPNSDVEATATGPVATCPGAAWGVAGTEAETGVMMWP